MAEVDPIKCTVLSVVKRIVDQTLTVLRDRQMPLAQRQDKLRQIVVQTFDFREMARSAMGYHWRELTPQQRNEFTHTFIAFIEDAYLSKLNDYKGQSVDFLSQRNDGPDYARVNTQIVQQDRNPIEFNFLVERESNDWKIYDVTVDANSIIANYRNRIGS